MVGEPNGLTLRYIADQLKEYRDETREARHEQNNRFQAMVAEVRRDFEVRMRAIEMENAASAPTTIGPRLQSLERWQGALDENQQGGAPKRMNELEAWRDQMTGSLRTLQITVTLLGGISAVLGIIAFFKP
jgi:hypothetical protein